MHTYTDIIDALYPDTVGRFAIKRGLQDAPEEWSDTLTDNSPTERILISPKTEAGIAYVFGVDDEATPDSWRDSKLKPTAVFFNGSETAILIWSFESPVTVADAQPIADALGMAQVDEFIPLPDCGDTKWACVHCDSSVYYALSDIQSAYGCTAQSNDLPRYRGAVCLTPYDPEDPRYQQPMTITVGGNKESIKWRPDTMPVSTFIMRLADHREGKKDGPAFVTGDMVPGRRFKTGMKAQYAVGLDVDNGMSSESIDKVLVGLGFLAIRYTTHSHAKTQTDFKKDTIVKWAPGQEIDDELMRRYVREEHHWDESIVATVEYTGTDHTERGIVAQITHAPMPKNRVVIPFAKPFVIEEQAATQLAAMEKWSKVPLALAEKLGIVLDKTGTDPSRLFYFPRHAHNRPFEIAIVGGELFDWSTLELENPFEEMVRETNKGTGKSKTDEGKALGRWSMKAAHGFQIVDVLEEHCPDRIRGNASTGVDIECPFDDSHSNAGDPEDRACFAVNAGDGNTEWFTISCRHDSCHGLTMLDMLGKMVKDGWFDRKVLDDEKYNAVASEDAPQPVVGENAVRSALKKLSVESMMSEVEAVVALIVDSDLREGRAKVALAEIVELTGGRNSSFKSTTLNAMLKAAKEDKEKRRSDGPSSKSLRLKNVLSKSLKSEFCFPPPHLGKFSLEEVGGKIWLCQSGGENNRISTPFVLAGGVVYADRGNARALRVDVMNQNNKWVSVDIHAGDLATATGVDALRKLMSAGLALTPKGKDFVTAYLMESQPNGPIVYDRAGFHDEVFICPTGEIIPKGAHVELAREKRVQCPTTAGSYENWRVAVAAIFQLPVEVAFLFQSGVLMGLAGTVANLAEDEFIQFGLYGETSSGKSTAEAEAVGSWCKPDIKEKGLMLSAKGTDNSQEVVFERSSGSVAVLDEFGHLPAKTQKEIVFMGQQGTGKRRLNANSEEKHARAWKGGCIVYSSERSIASRLRQEGVKAEGGLFARIFPISTDGVARLEANQFAHVEGVIRNYGWSGPEFVRALRKLGYVTERGGLKEKVRALIGKLKDTQGAENALRRRAARHLAYLWLAGLIAQEANMIPDDYDLEALANKLWKDALESDSGPTDPNKRALENLVDAITARKDVDIVPYGAKGDERRYREAIGYYDDAMGRYIIRVSKFDELCGDAISGRAFRGYLEDNGYLVRKAGDDTRTWRGYDGLGKEANYVVLVMAKIDG
ncbi:MAG TPA: DUF927 domain-containing protein [Rhizomicrobium sp.]